MSKSCKGRTFVDHYAVLACSPDASFEELKRAYRDKLRQFHPDKRHTSTGFGVQKTQSLNEAWELLRDPSRREAYDIAWRRENGKVVAEKPVRRRQDTHEDTSLQAAELRRIEGNRHYKEAQLLAQSKSDRFSFREAMSKYQLAIKEYTEGIQLGPRNHRLWSNRALCHAALKDWSHCREDALRVTQLEPNFMKGWFLLVKATWKLGSVVAALTELRNALRLLPESPELLALQAEIHADRECSSEQERTHLPHIPTGRGSSSRNVSPCVTPPGSRVSTPPPIHSSRSPGPRRDTSPGYSNMPRSSTNTPPRGYPSRDTSLPRVPKERRGRDASPYWNNTPSESQSGTPPPNRRGRQTMADRCKKTDDSPGWSNTPPDSRESSPATQRKSEVPSRRHGSRQRVSANVRKNVAAAFSALGADDIG